MKLGILATHPIQYHAPLFRELAGRDDVDLTVYFAHRPTPAEQGAGFGVDFAWDVDLLSGYRHRFLGNVARHPVQGFNGYDTPEIATIIAREKFDYFVVHGWNNRSCWQAFRACWRTGTPLAVRSDSQLPQGQLPLSQLVKQAVKRLVYRYFIRRFDLCLPYGQRSAEYFRRYDAQRIAIAPHFVDNDYFAREAARHVPQRDHLRRRWGIPTNACCFLFCGKFIAQKRPLDLLKALDSLLTGPDQRSKTLISPPLDDTPTKPVHLLMVGDGVLRQDCEHFAVSRQLPVTFAGFLNQGEVGAAYAVSDCLVLSSDSETWGLVVNEAMACGVPAVVSDVCGCVPDLIIDDISGFSFRSRDVGLLSEKLWLMIKKDDVSFSRMKIHVQRMINNYTARKAASAILHEIQQVGAGGNPT